MDAPLPILAVIKNRCNLRLLNQFLEREGYPLRSAADLDEFEAILQRRSPIGLALIDPAGFDPDIWKPCQQLNRHGTSWYLLVPQIRLHASQQEALRRGGSGALVKPLSFDSLRQLLRRVPVGQS